jgi:hypothetical protein
VNAVQTVSFEGRGVVMGAKFLARRREVAVLYKGFLGCFMVMFAYDPHKSELREVREIFL